MAEQKITISIDEDGSIILKTDGFYGESCIEAVNEFIESSDTIIENKKTDDYYKKASIVNKNIEKQRI